MTPTVEEVYQLALALPEEVRLDLADALVAASGHPPIPALTGDDYAAEVRRRSGDTDPAAWSSRADARRRVHARLRIAFSLASPPPGGWLPDDEITREWLQAIQDYRDQCDREDRARILNELDSD